MGLTLRILLPRKTYMFFRERNCAHHWHETAGKHERTVHNKCDGQRERTEQEIRPCRASAPAVRTRCQVVHVATKTGNITSMAPSIAARTRDLPRL